MNITTKSDSTAIVTEMEDSIDSFFMMLDICCFPMTMSHVAFIYIHHLTPLLQPVFNYSAMNLCNTIPWIPPAAKTCNNLIVLYLYLFYYNNLEKHFKCFLLVDKCLEPLFSKGILACNCKAEFKTYFM